MVGSSQQITPLAVTLHQTSRQLEVSFSDGVTIKLPFELMRVFSPSAEVQGHSPEQAVLQVGHRLVSIMGLDPVGHYGLRPRFSDGHDTGIFTWDYLRKLSADADSLWRAYEESLKAAGASRDRPAPPKTHQACPGGSTH